MRSLLIYESPTIVRARRWPTPASITGCSTASTARSVAIRRAPISARCSPRSRSGWVAKSAMSSCSHSTNQPDVAGGRLRSENQMIDSLPTVATAQNGDTLLFEVTDLKQWTYCPRVLYYRYCLPEIRPMTDLMRAGIGSHGDEVGREERRSLRTYGISAGERAFDLGLRSVALGLRGRLDLAIAVPDRAVSGAEAIVVEYRDSEKAAGPHFKLQLAAYALLLEEAWGLPVRRGFIYSIPLRTAEIIGITSALRQKVRQTVTDMQVAISGERMPAAPASRRPCVSCEFRRFCNDVV
jgi:CRISPR-associated exonuclease Cas4